jgi:hypothetical protein
MIGPSRESRFFCSPKINLNQLAPNESSTTLSYRELARR